MAQPTQTDKALSQTTETPKTDGEAASSTSDECSASSRPTKPIDADILSKDRELREHLVSLKLESLDQYVSWCEQNGFSTAIKKNWKQRCKEKYFFAKSGIESRRKGLKEEKRRPNAAINAAFSGGNASKGSASAWAKRIAKIANEADPSTRSAFKKIIEQLHAVKSPLLKTDGSWKLDGGPVHLIPGLQYPEFDTPQNSFLEALATICLYESSWIRPVESWKPQSKNVEKQFASLVRHLFAKYPTPNFMDCVWFEGDKFARSERHQWFIQLSQGTSVRNLGLPLPITKKMAHHFLQTPKGLGIMAAIRRAQVQACGGADHLLTGLLSTRIAMTTDHNEFWLSVIQWLVDHPMLSKFEFGPVVDFFHHRKFDMAEEGRASTNFSPRAMSPNRVIQEMHRWHAGMRKLTLPDDADWGPHPIFKPFQHAEADGSFWEISQLLSVQELKKEGSMMRHCVLSYAGQCKRGSTTIWSMTVNRKNMGRRRRVLTIEVLPQSGRVVQIRGRSNRRAKMTELAIVRRWANSEGLRLRS